MHLLSREIIFHVRCDDDDDDASYVRFGETKDKTKASVPEAPRHRNLRSDSVYTGYIGTGAILVPGFGTQP